MPTFETPRLQLRPLGQADQALYCRLYSDAGVMRHIGAPLSAEAARTAFAAVIRLTGLAAPTMQVWVLRDRACGVDVGILALIQHADEPDAREIGTMLLAEGQGRGIAAEAQTALLDWVFGAPGVDKVGSRHAPGHGAAIAVKQKLGFVRPDERAVLDSDVHDTVPRDHRVRWEISRERWNAGPLAGDGNT